MAHGKRGEVLVAILKEKSDLAILQDQGWYRIPVRSAPRRWPPKWLAFYQPSAFKEDAYRIRYYGQVVDIMEIKRRELFPTEFESTKSDQLYYRLQIESLEEREQPIPSFRPRRLVFVPTTWEKFVFAEQINDLFDDSPLEDRLWVELKKLLIGAERQWGLQVNQQYYQLDFALFCTKGQIDIETDGEAWHAQRERIPLDNQRDNSVQTVGWNVLRFTGKHINEQMGDYCLGKIGAMINRLGGLSDEGLVPRQFFSYEGGRGQQLSLFESPEEYRISEATPLEFD